MICENIEGNQFEELLESYFLDIKPFLDSYIVTNVDDKNIDLTINILKSYMPVKEVRSKK